MQVVQQALHALRRLGDMLGSVLAPREFVRVAAAVVQALAHRAVGARSHHQRAPNLLLSFRYYKWNSRASASIQWRTYILNSVILL